MARTQTSREFELERDLVAVLQDESGKLPSLKAKARANHCKVFPQVQVHASGLRIPDLVLVFSPERPAAVPEALTYFEAAVLADVVENSAVTLAAIAKRLFVSEVELQKRLSKLEKLGLVKASAAGYISNRKALPNCVRIVAIEAKLSDWSQAARQARGYFQFAHEAYIAMPPDRAQRPKVIEHCATLGVGVLSVQASGDVSVVLPSDDRKPTGPEYLRLLSATIGVAAR